MKSKNNEVIAWFKLENYQEINALPDHMLWQEFEVRKTMFIGLKSNSVVSRLSWSENGKFQRYYNQIVQGNARLVSDHEASGCADDIRSVWEKTARTLKVESLYFYDCKAHVYEYYSYLENCYDNEFKARLTFGSQYSDCVTPLTCNTISNLYKIFKSCNYECSQPAEKWIALNPEGTVAEWNMDKVIRDNSTNESVKIYPNKLHLEIDLNARDDQIVSSIEELLPQWRSNLGIPDGKPIKERKGSSHSDISLARRYQCIALLDLMIFEIRTGNKLDNNAKAWLLHPFGVRDGKMLLESDIPFLFKLLSKNYVKFDEKA